MPNFYFDFEKRGKHLETIILHLPESYLFDNQFQYVQERQFRVKDLCPSTLKMQQSFNKQL